MDFYCVSEQMILTTDKKQRNKNKAQPKTQSKAPVGVSLNSIVYENRETFDTQ